MKGHVFTVGEVNLYLKSLMEADNTLSAIYVRGEISNYKYHSSGHHYMTLKDENGTLRAVMFKFDARNLKFRPENGMKIIAKGRITVFPRDGQYQLYIADMIPDGVGALYIAFEQLKKKLLSEGMFDPEKKKPIPQYPESIALVTSPTGAAVRDMLRILKARYPLAKIMIYPVLVQGADAPADIVDAINTLNQQNACELIITGRGGGSLEDLWGFNDEMVARAIYASRIPIISAVGHEPDVTIADFVADIRAATPSNAAELAVPDVMHLRGKLHDYSIRMTQYIHNKLKIYREYLKKSAEKPVMQSPLSYFAERRIALDHIAERLSSIMRVFPERRVVLEHMKERLLNNIRHKVSAERECYIALISKLDALSPIKVLARGYSIVTTEGGSVIKSCHDTHSGEKLNLRVQDGVLSCIVDDIREDVKNHVG